MCISDTVMDLILLNDCHSHSETRQFGVLLPVSSTKLVVRILFVTLEHTWQKGRGIRLTLASIGRACLLP